jgi:hypothetical protein
VVRRDRARELAAVGVLERDGDLVRVLPAWQNGSWGPGQQRLLNMLDGVHIVGSTDVRHIVGSTDVRGRSLAC